MPLTLAQLVAEEEKARSLAAFEEAELMGELTAYAAAQGERRSAIAESKSEAGQRNPVPDGGDDDADGGIEILFSDFGG